MWPTLRVVGEKNQPIHYMTWLIRGEDAVQKEKAGHTKTKGPTMSKMGNQELNSSLSRSHSTVFSPHHSPLHISFVVTLITVMTGQFLNFSFLLEKCSTPGWYFTKRSPTTQMTEQKKYKCLALYFEKRRRKKTLLLFTCSLVPLKRVPKVLQMLNAPVREINWRFKTVA